MLTAVQLCCLTGSVGRTAFVPPLSSYGLDPYLSILLGPLILEVELSKCTREFTNICCLCELWGSRFKIGKLQDCLRFEVSTSLLRIQVFWVCCVALQGFLFLTFKHPLWPLHCFQKLGIKTLLFSTTTQKTWILEYCFMTAVQVL